MIDNPFNGSIHNIEFPIQDVIEKPIWGVHGKNISLIEILDSELIKDGFLYQKRIVNHKKLKEIANNNAFNTVRVLTYITDQGSVDIMAIVLRLSNNNGITDNFAQGGIAVGVDKKTGVLNDFGKDKMGNRYTIHPKGQVYFKNFKLPLIDEVLGVANECATLFNDTRLAGWDIAITAGGVMVLEGNRLSDFYLSQSQGELFRKSKYYTENDLGE